MTATAHDGADASAPALAMPVTESATWKHPRFRRRRFLVHRRYQLRITAVTVGTVFVLLLALNFAMFASSHRSTQAAARSAPELERYFTAQDRFQLLLTVLGSITFLGGVFLLGILETHRTAGASFNLCRCLDQIRDGRYRVRARLRRGDNLKEIEIALNEMVEALQQRSHRDAAILDELAARLERIRSEDAPALTHELRKLAGEKRLAAE